MRQVTNGTPVILGGALVVPAGLLRKVRGEGPALTAADAAARKRIETLAMRAVIKAEEAKGHRVVDVSAQKCGWDVSSYPPNSTDPKHIEVKGRVKGADTITVTRNEILYAFNQGEKFVLAIVFVNPDDSTEGPHYLDEPVPARTGLGSGERELLHRRTAQAGEGDAVTVISPKKLIEVALPLDAINVAAALREKVDPPRAPLHASSMVGTTAARGGSGRHLRPTGSRPRRPLAMPEPRREPNQQVKGHWTKARAKLFKIIEDLGSLGEHDERDGAEGGPRSHPPKLAGNVRTEQGPSAGEGTLRPGEDARPSRPVRGRRVDPARSSAARPRSIRERPEPGRGAHQQGDDRDPAEVRGQAPGPSGRQEPLMTWTGAAGLPRTCVGTVQWMRDEAFKRIGHLYPTIEITKEMVKERPDLKPYEGEKLTVIAWLWARTVKSPNPAFSHSMCHSLARSCFQQQGREGSLCPASDRGRRATRSR